MKNTLLIILLYSFYGSTLAQNSISTSGETIASTTGNISYVVGQTFYSDLSGSTGSINEGVLQIEEISEDVLGLVLGHDRQDISITIFPNPTSDNITIEWDRNISGSFDYHLVNLKGQIIQKGTLDLQENSINVSNLSPSIYYLSLVNRENPIKKFKIVKN